MSTGSTRGGRCQLAMVWSGWAGFLENSFASQTRCSILLSSCTCALGNYRLADCNMRRIVRPRTAAAAAAAGQQRVREARRSSGTGSAPAPSGYLVGSLGRPPSLDFDFFLQHILLHPFNPSSLASPCTPSPSAALLSPLPPGSAQTAPAGMRVSWALGRKGPSPTKHRRPRHRRRRTEQRRTVSSSKSVRSWRQRSRHWS